MVHRGLSDLQVAKPSIDAFAVSVASHRLSALGLPIRAPLAEPEIGLYDLLRRQAGPGDDPYLRYCALLRELDSFLEALEGRARRSAATTGGPPSMP